MIKFIFSRNEQNLIKSLKRNMNTDCAQLLKPNDFFIYFQIFYSLTRIRKNNKEV